MDGLVKRKYRNRAVKKNKLLCERYPFLIPWHRFTGERFVQEDRRGRLIAVKDYDWSYTELDDMPDGWRDAFGLQMCEEIREALIEDNDLERWQIVQMKEKYGSLRVYDNGHRIGSRVPDILEKYEKLSGRICILCGAPATRIAMGWVSPYCDRCCPEKTFLAIDEYYREDNEDEQ